MKALSVVFASLYGFSAMVFSFHVGSNRSQQVNVDRFDGTCRGHKVPLIFNYQNIKFEGDNLVMNSTITAREDIPSQPILSFQIRRCKNRENPDTCEEFHHSMTDKYCSLIEADSQIWSSLFQAYSPKWKCPIKKGVYRGTNNVLDISGFLLFPMDNWVWRITGELTEKGTDRLLMCIFVEAHVLAKPAN